MRLAHFHWLPLDKLLRSLSAWLSNTAKCSRLQCRRWTSRRILFKSGRLGRFPSFLWRIGWGIPGRVLWHGDVWFWYIWEAYNFYNKANSNGFGWFDQCSADRKSFTAPKLANGSSFPQSAYVFFLATRMAPSMYPQNSSEKSLPRTVMLCSSS